MNKHYRTGLFSLFLACLLGFLPLPAAAYSNGASIWSGIYSVVDHIARVIFKAHATLPSAAILALPLEKEAHVTANKTEGVAHLAVAALSVCDLTGNCANNLQAGNLTYSALIYNSGTKASIGSVVRFQSSVLISGPFQTEGSSMSTGEIMPLSGKVISTTSTPSIGIFYIRVCIDMNCSPVKSFNILQKVAPEKTVVIVPKVIFGSSPPATIQSSSGGGGSSSPAPVVPPVVPAPVAPSTPANLTAVITPFPFNNSGAPGGNFYPGQIIFRVGIKNIGQTDAGAFGNTLQISNDGVAYNDLETASFDITSLTAGDGHYFAYTWNNSATGSFYFRFCADNNNAIAESDETDNCSAAVNVVVITSPNGPVWNFILNSATLNSDGSVTLNYDKSGDDMTCGRAAQDNVCTMGTGVSYTLMNSGLASGDSVRICQANNASECSNSVTVQ